MKIFLAGDICPTENTMSAITAGDLDTAFGTVCGLVRGADRFIANLECALTTSDTPIRKEGPNLRATPECAVGFAKLGITDVGLSNNHVYDYGHAGFRDTLNALDAAGILYTGIGENEQAARRPHYMDVCGRRLAVIAVCDHEYSYALRNREGCWGFDPFETMEDIAIAKAQSDYVIVMYHGGKEHCRYPTPRQRRACQAMVRAGADLVLCQHTHCIGVPEHYRGGLIVYGQGNFNFVKNLQNPMWRDGLLLELDWRGAKPDYIFHPVVVNEHGITLAEGEDKERLLREFYERQNTLLNDDAWLEQWDAYCRSVEPGYRRSIENAFSDEVDEKAHQLFRVYLDSECHTDIYRWLYPTWNGDNTIEKREQ